ncbi:unnamed protein product [Ectocarpus sp. 8 AP-2014]
MHPHMMGGAAAAAAAALVFLVLAVFAVNPSASGATTGGPDENTPHYNNAGAQSRDARRAVQELGCGVTGACATLDTCGSDSSDADCAAPDSYVCEHKLPGLSVCESPPVASMQPCWMSGLDGALRLNQISLPGTHDTMSKGISACLQEGLANYVHTQAWSLRTMLDTGVRAIDVRVRRKSDLSLVLEHGIVELPFGFDVDVRDVLASFLTDNPTETVVMFYQMNDLAGEDSSGGVTAEDTLQASMSQYPDLWLDGAVVPTLEEARGKVVLPTDMGQEEQNDFNLGSFEAVATKKGLVRDFFLEGGGVPADGGPFRLNYLSGTGTYVYPLTVAAGLKSVYQGTNEVVFEFSGGSLGVVMFDFVGEDAVAHVVAQQGTDGLSWDQPQEESATSPEISGAT